MAKIIGVTSSWQPSTLKREMLLFDKIVISDPSLIHSLSAFSVVTDGSDFQDELAVTVLQNSTELDFF